VNSSDAVETAFDRPDLLGAGAGSSWELHKTKQKSWSHQREFEAHGMILCTASR
jgi:hypothetical protein